MIGRFVSIVISIRCYRQTLVGKEGWCPLKNGTSSNWCSDLYTVLLSTIGGYRGMASTEEQHSISPVWTFWYGIIISDRHIRRLGPRWEEHSVSLACWYQCASIMNDGQRTGYSCQWRKSCISLVWPSQYTSIINVILMIKYRRQGRKVEHLIGLAVFMC